MLSNQRRNFDSMFVTLWSGLKFRSINVIDEFNKDVLHIDIDINLPAIAMFSQILPSAAASSIAE